MSCELFIGNLNPEVRMRDLENCFGRYGKIQRCDLKKNFAFIQFEDRRDAEEAIRKENNRRLLGSVMTVEWAKGSVGDKQQHQRFRRPQSPPRFPNKSRERSPFDSRRERSPLARRDFGDRRGSGGRDSYDNRSNFDSRRDSPRDSARDRFSNGERYLNDRRPSDDRGSRGAPRENGFSDRDRYADRRDSFGERRSFASGPRRF